MAACKAISPKAPAEGRLSMNPLCWVEEEREVVVFCRPDALVVAVVVLLLLRSNCWWLVKEEAEAVFFFRSDAIVVVVAEAITAVTNIVANRNIVLVEVLLLFFLNEGLLLQYFSCEREHCLGNRLFAINCEMII